jgi:hypothetical protein
MSMPGARHIAVEFSEPAAGVTGRRLRDLSNTRRAACAAHAFWES